MNNLMSDLRSGIRQLLKQPWSSAFAIGALALSIGAITELFAAANALLLEPVRGIRDPARVIETGRASDGVGFDTAQGLQQPFAHQGMIFDHENFQHESAP